MRRLETVSCSLNLGFIYNISYSYSPEGGVAMTIFFVNERGEYSKPNLLPMQKTNIRIGPASFSLYAKSFKISKSPGRRVISVDFVDETFMLDKYYIALTGRGCGKNIYELGTSVDRRTVEQKIAATLDPNAEKIKQFTQFEDVEYSFNDFLEILRQKFSVVVNANYDTTITRNKTGTFRDVLSDWCNFYNLSFYFENSQIKIYDPTRLTINIPEQNQISNPISYEYAEDITSTYTKTVSRYFQQEGGEKSFNNTDGDGSDSTGQSNDIKVLTLFPIGYEFNLEQTLLDTKQVAAAMYGKEFWLLYNMYNDTLQECGWTKLTGNFRGNNVAQVNSVFFDEKFEAYSKYGNSIAGRWYLSDRIDSLDILQDCSWFEEASGQIFNLNSESADKKRISIEYLESDVIETKIIKGTEINETFPGINFVGKRLAFYDQKDRDFETVFGLSDEMKSAISKVYKGLFIEGSGSIDYSNVTGFDATKEHISYPDSVFPSEIVDLINQVKNGDKDSYLLPRYPSFPIKGSRKSDLINKKDIQNQPETIEPTRGQNQNIITNTSLIKTKKDGAYVVYYDKYLKCSSKHSDGNYFKHHFDVDRISEDVPVNFIFNKTANTYSLNRDISTIEALLNNPYMQALAEPRTFPTKTATFSVNYYYPIPMNFLSNGLVGLQMEIGNDGLSCSYTFSNSVLMVPDRQNEFKNYENSIRNSLLRKYNPTEVID